MPWPTMPGIETSERVRSPSTIAAAMLPIAGVVAACRARRSRRATAAAAPRVGRSAPWMRSSSHRRVEAAVQLAQRACWRRAPRRPRGRARRRAGSSCTRPSVTCPQASPLARSPAIASARPSTSGIVGVARRAAPTMHGALPGPRLQVHRRRHARRSRRARCPRRRGSSSRRRGPRARSRDPGAAIGADRVDRRAPGAADAQDDLAAAGVADEVGGQLGDDDRGLAPALLVEAEVVRELLGGPARGRDAAADRRRGGARARSAPCHHAHDGPAGSGRRARRTRRPAASPRRVRARGP